MIAGTIPETPVRPLDAPRPPLRPRGQQTGRAALSPKAQDRTLTSRRLTTGAFTLMEVLVVIGIIVVLAVSSVPAIRSLTQANTLASGSRQVLDELNLARRQALSSRRTVYMVFVPPTIGSHVAELQAMPAGRSRDQALRQFTNLVAGQYRAYALFSKRTVGDQPGRETPRYLDGGWKLLPDGMFFATNKFVDLGSAWTNQLAVVVTNRVLPYAWFPFPTAESELMRMPYIAFDPSGRLTFEGQPSQTIQMDAGVTLLRGSVFYAKDNQDRYLLSAGPDVVTTPPANRTDIVVNWITGRPRVLETKVE